MRAGWLPVAGAGVLGLIVGSFLNVVAFRLPRGQSIIRPGSRCPRCASPIPARHNIPILSWIVLRGRCHNCRGKIALRYPLGEACCGVLFTLVAASSGMARWLVLAALLAAALCLVSRIIQRRRIYRRLAWSHSHSAQPRSVDGSPAS